MLHNFVWCDNQPIGVDGKVYCLAHSSGEVVCVCPYADNADRLRSKYPCTDYKPDYKKEVGL